MNCSSCQAPAAPGVRFCGQCGTKLAMTCPGCQHPNPAGSMFCEACGRPAGTTPGDRRVVTVLFTDVSGFTAMSEKLDAGEVTRLVNRFFTVLTRPIYKYGGVVDKYIGDAIMALFGAPVAHEDDPERALAAAWEMQEAAAKFAADLEQRTGIRLRVRVGLNTGLVVAGAVGGDQKRDYTVMGDSVNLASKMEANARPGAILVSEETYRLTKHCWNFLELDPVAIPGRQRAVRVFEPQAPKGPEQLDVVERPAFIGREAELLKLELALDETMRGTPQAMILVGEAGIGKSRLAREFLARMAMPRGARVIRARCLSYQREVSHSLVASLLTDWVGPSDQALDHARLESWCRNQGARQPERDSELLGHFLGLPLRSQELKLLSPEVLRNLARQTLEGYLLHSEAGPTVLSLNDLQWADDASRAWLNSLLDACGRHREGALPLLLLMQYRPDGEGLITEDGRLSTQRMRLRPLSTKDGEQLVREFLDLRGPVEQDAFRQVLSKALEQAEGNPFYLCELIRSLTEAEVLVRQGGSWRLNPERSLPTLPPTIHGVVASRVDRLSPGARQVIQVAAVLGREFSRALLAEACQAEEIGHALAELVDSELVHHRVRQPGHYVFHQAIIQEVAYEGLLVKVRRELHRRIGLLIEEKAAYQPAEQAQLLAYHFKHAEDAPRAMRYLYLAGQHAQASFDNAQARSNFEEALQLREKLGAEQVAEPTVSVILAGLSEIESTLGAYPEALSHLARALSESRDLAERARIRRRMGGVQERLGTYDEAIATYEAALAELGETEPALRAALLGAIAYAHYGLGRFELAMQRCQEALPHLTQDAHRKDRAFCYSVTGLALGRMGRYQEAMQAHADALRLREACEDTLGVGSSSNNLSQMLYELGEYDRSRECLERAIEAFGRVGDQAWIATGHNNLGALLLERGELEDARAHFTEAIALCRKIGFASRLGLALCNQGSALTKLGRHEEAIRSLLEGVESIEGLRNFEVLPQGLQLLSQTYLACDRLSEAWEIIVKGLKLVKHTKSQVQRGVFYALAGSVYSRSGNHPAALSWISKAIGVLAEVGNQLELGRAWFLLARALWAADQKTYAASAAVRARALFIQLDARYDRQVLDRWLDALQTAPART